jgi:hypothetical protein
MRSALLACVLAYATAYTAQDVRRRAVTSPHVSLFVHVESPHAEAAHEMKDSKVVAMQGGSSHSKMQGSSHNASQKGVYEGRFTGEDAAETGLLRAPTQQELEMAHMKEMQALQILQDPDLRAAAEQTSQLIQAAMQDVDAGDFRELGQDRPTDTCDVCGKNSDGVLNCCSKGGSWQDTCKDLSSEGGPHTWIDGFNACKEEVTQAEKDEQDEAEKQRVQQQKENEKHDAEQKELKAQQKKEAQKKKEDDAAAAKKKKEEADAKKHAIATHAVPLKKSKPKSLYPNRSAKEQSGDADESSTKTKAKTKGADADELTGEADTEQTKYLKASKQDSMEDKESEEIVTEESGKDEMHLAKEMAKESSIDITLSDEDLEESSSGSGEPLSAEEANLSPDERAAERYEAEAKAEAAKAAEAARQEWEQQAKEQQEADDDLSPDEKAALQYEAEEAAEAAAKASLEAAGIDPEEEKQREEKKAKKKAQAEMEAGQIAAPSKEEMDVARAAGIVREAADKAFAERQANAKIAAEEAKKAHQALQDEEAQEGMLRQPTKQELEVAAQQAAQQASADSAREEAGMLRPPTPEELTAAARVKTAEGNTAEAEELMKAAKEAREKLGLGQQAVDNVPEEGLLRAATPEELAKAAAGDKRLAPVTPEQQQAATKAAEKIEAQQAIEQEAEEEQQAQQQQKQQQQAAQAEAGLKQAKQAKQQQADTAFASLTPSDEKQEMAFGDFMKAQKRKEKLDYDPNDGLIINEPKVPKQKDDLATKVAEMNKAAEERHKADQADDLETGQLRTATDSEAAHAAQTGEGGQTQQQGDAEAAVPDRIKSMEAGIDKTMKDGGMKNTDRTAADGSENPDADARSGRQEIRLEDLPGAEGQAARAAEEAGMISETAMDKSEVQLMREQPSS